MPRNYIPFSERGYELLVRAEARAPHPPTAMMSGNTRGPVAMWCCAWAGCGEVRYTYQPGAEAPTCGGGMYWSFVTEGAVFDASVHTLGALR